MVLTLRPVAIRDMQELKITDDCICFHMRFELSVA